MADEGRADVARQRMEIDASCRLIITPHPEPADPAKHPEHSGLIEAMQTYLDAAMALRVGAYRGVAHLFPAHVASNVRLYIVVVVQGVFFRWVPDPSRDKSTVYLLSCASMDWRDMICFLSNGYVRVEGWETELTRTLPRFRFGASQKVSDGQRLELASAELGLVIPNELPPRTNEPGSFRPFGPICIEDAVKFQISATTPSPQSGPGVKFSTLTPAGILLEWSRLEFYRKEDVSQWAQQNAAIIAECDVLHGVAQRAADQNGRLLRVVDSQRRWFWLALEQLESLVTANSPEELLHQHIKAHPWLLVLNARGAALSERRSCAVT